MSSSTAQTVPLDDKDKPADKQPVGAVPALKVLKTFKGAAAMFFRDPSDGSLNGPFLAASKFGSLVDVPVSIRAQVPARASNSNTFKALRIVMEFPFGKATATEQSGHGVSHFGKYHTSFII